MLIAAIDIVGEGGTVWLTVTEVISRTILAFMVYPKALRDLYSTNKSALAGDEDLCTALNQRALEYDPSSYWSTHHLRLNTIATKALAKAQKQPKPDKPAKLYNPYEGQLSCRQLSETIADFLSRLVPSSSLPTDIGDHWIRIANPYSPERPTSEDWRAFTAATNEYLEVYRDARAKVEATMPGKAKGTVTRKIAPLRKQLEVDILSTAQKTGCTTGKWLLFVGIADVDPTWGRVAKGTAENELGVAAKVAANGGSDEDGKERLICVYTRDFEDKGDIKRVLKKLKELGLLRRADDGERLIYYKCGKWYLVRFIHRQLIPQTLSPT